MSTNYAHRFAAANDLQRSVLEEAYEAAYKRKTAEGYGSRAAHMGALEELHVDGIALGRTIARREYRSPIRTAVSRVLGHIQDWVSP